MQETQSQSATTPIEAQETAQPPQETPTTTTPPVETKQETETATPKPKKEKPLTDWQKRYAITKNFAGKRGEMVKTIVEEGIKQGNWQSVSHFMDKVVDFAINSQAANKALNIKTGFQFGIPDGVTTELFENGYYNQLPPLQNKLPICK